MKLINYVAALIFYISVFSVYSQLPNVHLALSPGIFSKLKGIDILKLISNQNDGSYSIVSNEFLKKNDIKELKITKAHFPNEITAKTIIVNISKYILCLTLQDMVVMLVLEKGSNKLDSSFVINELYIELTFEKGKSPLLTDIAFKYNLQLTFENWYFSKTTINFNGLLETIFQNQLFKDFANRKIKESLNKEISLSKKIGEHSSFMLSNMEGYYYPYIDLIKQSLSRKMLRSSRARTKSSNPYIVTDWFSLYLSFNNRMDLGDVFINKQLTRGTDYALSSDIGVVISKHFLIVAMANFINPITFLGHNFEINLRKLIDSFTITQESISATIQIDVNGKKIIDFKIGLEVAYMDKQIKLSIVSFDSDNSLINFLGNKLKDIQNIEKIEDIKRAKLNFDLEEYLNSFLSKFNSPVKISKSMLSHYKGCIVLEVNVKVDNKYLN